MKTKSKRFVLISDLHAHAWSAFAKGDGRENSRLRRSLQVLQDSLERARELDVPWVFAGDIVHTAGYTLNVVLSELIDTLVGYGDVTKLVTWGNHDARGIGGRITIEQTVMGTISRAVERFYVIDPGVNTIMNAGGLTFSGAGYQPSQSLIEYGEQSDVGIYHQTVRGTRTPNGFLLSEGIDPKELLQRHRISVVGHVHHWQHLVAQVPEMLLIPGSPEHHNFGDIGTHGWWIIDVPGPLKEPVATIVPGGSPEFRTVASPSMVKKDGNFYRVERVAAGESTPDDAAVISPSPTAIVSRDILRGARGEATVQAWLTHEPPQSSIIPIDKYLTAGRELLQSKELANLRPLRLKTIKMQNFCSYEEQEIEVRPGTWLVIGKGKDFPSNGAGKTTLFESVFWLLFGRTTKGLTGDEVIKWGKEYCQVSAYFEAPEDYPDADWLHVVRSRGKHSTLTVQTPQGKMEAKSVNELTDKLAQYLGLTPELYQALGYFSQEKLLLFASATDGERKDMLSDLIGLSCYQEASSAAQKKHDEIATAFEKSRAVHQSVVSRMEAEEKRHWECQRRSDAWSETQKTIVEQKRTALRDFDATFEQVHQASLSKYLDDLSGSAMKRLEQARKEIAQYEVYLAEPAETHTLEELKAARHQQSETVGALVALRERLKDCEGRRAVAIQRLFNIQKDLETGICPSCRQPVSDEHREVCIRPAQDDLDELDAQMLTIDVDRRAALERALQVKELLGKLEKGVEVAVERDHQQSEIAVRHKLIAQIEEEIRQQVAVADVRVTDVLMTHRSGLEQQIVSAINTKNPFEAEEESILARGRELAAELKLINAQEDAMTVTKAVYAYWQKGFSKQGIQSLLVDEVASLFNSVRGSIFPALTQGVYDVQFSTITQTKSGEWRERTEFQVYQKGELVPYSALSGGQRRRIDVGVMLTLVKAVSTWMQVPGMLGTLVLDEVFGFLDSSGAEGLMEALRELQEQIPNVFVVSHEPQLQALFPDVVYVEQDQHGTSRVVAS